MPDDDRGPNLEVMTQAKTQLKTMTNDNDINELEEIAKFCSALAELEEAADGDNGDDEQEEDTRNVDENQSTLADWGETE